MCRKPGSGGAIRMPPIVPVSRVSCVGALFSASDQHPQQRSPAFATRLMIVYSRSSSAILSIFCDLYYPQPRMNITIYASVLTAYTCQQQQHSAIMVASRDCSIRTLVVASHYQILYAIAELYQFIYLNFALSCVSNIYFDCSPA